MKQSIIILVLVTISLVASAFYYFFIDTLSVSEIVGDKGNAKTNIFVNLFDFDTGLTRYDIYNLKSKAPYWENQMQKVASIRDPTRRNIEHEKLVAEMMQDPAMKKIARKLFGFGKEFSLHILRAINAF